ncbi:hypothetical protein GWK47_017231 [Chionoecetes opilio]|uniref:Uncharacterized protein n=1 Tax=Chionoecetes opilio TaxID=41210 RepID=A0A8J4XSS6_CHIOP|nr:hypothetical protein GWK47_017231 [Chionoecetes opilio]
MEEEAGRRAGERPVTSRTSVSPLLPPLNPLASRARPHTSPWPVPRLVGAVKACGRRPVRTVSQVTLTMRKLSQVSDSSSSKDEVCDGATQDQLRARSLPKGPRHCQGPTTNTSSSSRREGTTTAHVEDTAIKPASHQVTRHSSSCSLASQPSSPTHFSSSSSSSTSWLPLTPSRTPHHHQTLQQKAPPLPTPPASSATSLCVSPPVSPLSRPTKVRGKGERSLGKGIFFIFFFLLNLLLLPFYLPFFLLLYLFIFFICAYFLFAI